MNRLTKATNVVIAIAVAAIAIGLAIYSPSLAGPVGKKTDSVSSTGCDAPPGYVLIVADKSGFNGSANRERPWPVISVQKGDKVNLMMCNLDRIEPHGFAIDKYVGPLALRPGETYKVSFVAEESGRFTMYCTIFCSVHVFMIGELVVTE